MKFLMLLGSVAIVIFGIAVLASIPDRPESKRKRITVCAALACLIFSQWSLFNGVYYSPGRVEARQVAMHEDELRSVKSACSNTALAFVMSQTFVKRSLVSPGSAVFPRSAISSETSGQCRFTISSYVDSHNALGVMIRTSYIAVLEYIPQSKDWKIISLVM